MGWAKLTNITPGPYANKGSTPNGAPCFPLYGDKVKKRLNEGERNINDAEMPKLWGIQGTLRTCLGLERPG
jgi:hypothetical protein